MANLISAADGNIDAIATVWAAVDPGAVSSQVVRTANTNTTTSYVYSSAITDTNLNVLDGILLYGNRLNTTGTVTVAYSQDNGTTDTRNVTVNASDLPVDPSWIFFKFGSNLTLDGGADNKVGIKASSAGNATFYRDGTAGNWTRRLRIVSLQSASAGDVLYIVGEHTGAGAITTRTITMNTTAAVDYGTGTDGAADNGIEIGDSGILQYGTTAATNYYLKCSGTINLWGNGTLNIGTTGTPIPRSGSAILELDPVADGGMGLIANPGGILNIQGQSRTSGKNVVACKLNSDAAANATSLSVDTDTGWLDNDQIAVASTTRTASQTELGALNGNAGASSLTVDGFAGTAGGVLNAHGGGGTSVGSVAISAEVINITRNIKIRSATSTIMAYVFANTTSLVDIDWAEFYYLGENATNKRGIEIAITTGSFSMQFSSLHDTEDGGVFVIGANANNIVFSSNVTYNLNTAAGNAAPGAGVMVCSTTNGTTGTNITFDSNQFLSSNVNALASGSNQACYILDLGITFTNNIIAGTIGAGYGSLGIGELSSVIPSTGTFSGNVIHSGAGHGFTMPIGGNVLNIGSMTIWRMTGQGVSFSDNSSSRAVKMTNLTAFGNTTQNLKLGYNNSPADGWGDMVFVNAKIDSDAAFTTATGVTFDGAVGNIYFINSSLGANTAHGTADLTMSTTTPNNVFLINTLLASATEVGNQTSMALSGSIRSSKHDASSTTHKAFYRNGTIAADQTTRHTASGYSWKMTPLIANAKLTLPGPAGMDTFKVAVKANSLVTISVYVQKDGSYAGNAPTLTLIGSILNGIANDVTASMVGGSGSWELLTVSATPTEDGVLEYKVDCDGTAGNVYVDDVSISQA